MQRIVFFAVLLALPRLSTAQDTPRFGIVMGYPAEVGVLWNVSSRVAVRPEIDWSKAHTETTSTTQIPTFTGTTVITTPISSTSTGDGWHAGIGVSALFYLSKGDALRTYVSPRFGYDRLSTTTDLGVPSALSPVATQPTTFTATGYSVSGSLGAQYALGKRFGVFGELGLSYTHTRDTTVPPLFIDSTSTARSVGLRSGVGIVLFFGE